ncbi:hypothetical protein MTP10_41445, partial [Nonomuraea sp. 3-1Str]|nr:hypothetical protein [Nonomuraea sp. 3-1Str]
RIMARHVPLLIVVVLLPYATGLIGESAGNPLTVCLFAGAVAASDGAHPPLGGWPDLRALPAADRPGARLAVLAALAPYRVTDGDVSAWRAGAGTTADAGAGADGGDEDLVRLIAYGAILATARAESIVTGRARAGAAPGPTE